MHRSLEEKHLIQTNNLLDIVYKKKQKLVPSSDYEDTKLSFDFKYDGMKVSHRIRDISFFDKYKQLTIRSKTKGGGKTELDKFKEGMSDIYFFGWADSIGIKQCLIVDINKLRPYLDYTDHKDIPNGDGTNFYAYDIRRLLGYGCVIAGTYQCIH